MAQINPGAAVVAFAVLLGSACSSEPHRNSQKVGSSDTAAEHSCSVLSLAEVAEVIGEPVVELIADANRCRYETEDAMASSVEIELVSSGGAREMETARAAIGTLREMGGELGEQQGAEGDLGDTLTQAGQAPALGDESFFGANQQLHVRKGDVYFAVTPPHMRSRMAAGSPTLSADQKREMAVRLAQGILRNL